MANDADESQEPVESSEDDPAAGDNGPADESPPPRRRGRKRQIIIAKAEELADWHFLRALDPRSALPVVLRGDGIGEHGGDLGIVGAGIVRVAGIFEAFNAKPVMESLAFGNSVTLQVRPSSRELERALSEVAYAEQLQQENATQDAVKHVLAAGVPDVYVAAALAADLLAAPSSQAPELAVEYGTEVTTAYRALANMASSNHVTVSIVSPEHRTPVNLSPEKAARVIEELKTSKERRQIDIPVYGVLSVADSDHKGFGLRPDPRRTRHPEIKGKQIIYGTYTPKVEQQMLELGLWGKRVRATIRVDRDVLISRADMRRPTYLLIDAQPDRN